MKIELRRGLLRSGIVTGVVAAVSALLAIAGGSLEAFLRWFDWLSAAPGLSGLAILIVSPFLVLLFLFAVNWVYTGFAGTGPTQVSCDSATSGGNVRPPPGARGTEP